MSLKKYLQKVKRAEKTISSTIAKIPVKAIQINPVATEKKKRLSNWKIFARISVIITLAIGLDTFFKPDDTIKQGDIMSSKLSSSSFSRLKDYPSFVFNTKGYHYPIVEGIHIDSLSKMNKRDFVAILLGGYVITAQIGGLYQGMEILNPNYGECSNSFLGIVAKDDRLYVWAKFIDLRTQNEIGEMALNHWTIYKDTYLDYHHTDRSFEVIDHQGYVVFSIAYRPASGGSPIVSIAGYFNSPTSVLVLDNHWSSLLGGYQSTGDFYKCIKKTEANWLQISQTEIAKITSIFK